MSRNYGRYGEGRDSRDYDPRSGPPGGNYSNDANRYERYPAADKRPTEFYDDRPSKYPNYSGQGNPRDNYSRPPDHFRPAPDSYSHAAPTNNYSRPVDDRYSRPADDRYSRPAPASNYSRPADDRNSRPAPASNYSRPADDRYSRPDDNKYGRSNEGGFRNTDQSLAKYGGGGGGGGRGPHHGGFQSGGRGGRGSGPRGPKHMGELQTVQSLMQQLSMDDSTILSVLSKSSNDRVISDEIPELDSWRIEPSPIGAAIEKVSGHCIRVNHYRLSDFTKIPAIFYQYHVEIRRVLSSNEEVDVSEEDITSSRKDMKMCILIIKEFLKSNGDSYVNFTYDGGHTLFSIKQLEGKQDETTGDNFISILNIPSLGNSYQVKIKLTATIFTPNYHINAIENPTDDDKATAWKQLDSVVLRVLDSSILAFARWQLTEEAPSWFIEGTKAYRSSGEGFSLGKGLVALKGYSSALKTSITGVSLTTDLSVSVFVEGGDLLSAMARAGSFRDVDDFTRSGRQGFPSNIITLFNNNFKNMKVKVLHLGHSRKIRGFGPPADHPDTTFDFNGNMITVADYFRIMAADVSKPMYKQELKYPFLPTVNIGSKNKIVLIPVELISITPGQSKSQSSSSDLQAKVIRFAAIDPDTRYKFFNDTHDGIVNVLKNDPIATSFGLSTINQEALVVNARILPPAKLLYGGNKVVNPSLSGSWFSTSSFYRPAKSVTKYALVIVKSGHLPREFDQSVNTFQRGLDNDSRNVGLNMQAIGNYIEINDNPRDLTELFLKLKDDVDIAVVVMMRDSYNLIKYCADKICFLTQCVKYDKLARLPKGYQSNCLLKINAKLGGINYALASRNSAQNVDYQHAESIPSSISWIYDRPTMLVGLDDSGVAAGDSGPANIGGSYHSIVGSLDNFAGQYGVYMTAYNMNARAGTINLSISEGIKYLFQCYHKRNGHYPEHVVIFRDGVSDNQFENVMREEIRAFRFGMNECGNGLNAENDVKISMLICQKRHATRFFYEDSNNNSFLNACPGVVVDAYGGQNSIASGDHLEFYINSHSPIQGTSKPCKYNLVFDQIGFTINEIELLTYWTTYLYSRCNKSTSIPAPVYYAHWGCRRAAALVGGGASPGELEEISRSWLTREKKQPVFFFL